MIGRMLFLGGAYIYTLAIQLLLSWLISGWKISLMTYDKFSCWTNINELTINVKKTKIMSYLSVRERSYLDGENIYLNGVKVEY